MASSPENRELINFLIVQDRKFSLIYSRLSQELGRILVKYKVKGKKNIWIGNISVRNKVNEVLLKYRRIILSAIRQSQVQAWNLSDDHNRSMVEKYLRGTEIDPAKYLTNTTKALKEFQKRSRNGLSLSNRVFRLNKNTEAQLSTFIAEGLTEKRTAAELARDLKRFLREPNKRFRRIKDPKTGKLVLSDPAKNYHPGRGVYRSSYANALRLARNEINIAYRSSDIERRKKLDFVLGVKVQLSNAHPMYDICDELQGKYPKDFNFIGWHPNCLCFTTSILASKKDFAQSIKTNDPIDESKNVSGIPKRAKIYLDKNADKIKSRGSKPYFITDNFKSTSSGFELKKNL